MMSRIFRPLVQTHIAAHSPHSLGVQRPASASANYSSFPASLLRYNASQKFGLYDCRKRHQQGDKLNWDGIKIENNDLVELGASKHPTRYRGAMMMPNTFTMQDIIRIGMDYYFDNEVLGRQVEIPFVYYIQKGTPLPSNLVLLREGLSRFLLQPSQLLSAENLDTLLDEYVEKYAEKKTPEQWLDDYDFNSAVRDDAVALWMAR